MDTIKVRKTIVLTVHAPIDDLHYGIEPGTTISYNHLLAVCLYTDFSDLCTDFSQSFRRIHNYESSDSIKVRNRNYHFMAKYL